MNKFLAIETQQELNRLLSGINWEDSFIREGHLVFPTYVTSDGNNIVASGSALAARILVCTPKSRYEGIELLFEELEDFYLPSKVELKPVGRYSVGGVEFRFFGAEGTAIRSSKKIRYCLVEQGCRGWDTRYAYENIFDEGGFLVI